MRGAPRRCEKRSSPISSTHIALAGAAACPVAAEHRHSAAAQNDAYQTRPVTIIVPFPAGGSADLNARTVAERLSAALGQYRAIYKDADDNRRGAGAPLAMPTLAVSGAGQTAMTAARPQEITSACKRRAELVFIAIPASFRPRTGARGNSGESIAENVVLARKNAASRARFMMRNRREPRQ